MMGRQCQALGTGWGGLSMITISNEATVPLIAAAGVGRSMWANLLGFRLHTSFDESEAG